MSVNPDRPISIELNFWQGTGFALTTFGRLTPSHPIELVFEIKGLSDLDNTAVLDDSSTHNDGRRIVVTDVTRRAVRGTIHLPPSAHPCSDAARAIALLCEQLARQSV